ncbi:MAG: hypothetical protein JXB85_15630 [Anaerolineales bacterium]|nr:hypothetical protein [Anaerolineales bacterium]
MDQTPEIDLAQAHRHFSLDCFNRAWVYLDMPTRSPQEDQAMLLLSLASLWHWTQRPDCTPGNLSVGYWQVARVYALLGQVEQARAYGQRCLESARGEGTLPFHLGYAYEALARAEALAGEGSKRDEYLRLAGEVSETMPDADARQMLLDDLATIP